MTKRKVVSFFSGKNGATPPVAAPGDTNSSDAPLEIMPVINADQAYDIDF